MHKVHIVRHKSLVLLISLMLLLVFALAACGANAGSGSTTSGSASGGTSTTSQGTQGPANASGCPTNTTVTTQSPASIILKPGNNNTTVNVKTGEIVEVDLPFGHMWSGPTASQGVLELQGPAGYPVASSKVCVWRFVARGAGTSQLEFEGRAICAKGALCPQYIMSVPFVIDVK